MRFRNKVEVYCRLDYYRRNMSEKLSGCWLFIGEDWWGSRKLNSPVLAFLGTLHLDFFMTFFYCSWGDVLRDRVKCYIDFNWVLTYCSGCSIDIFIYFHCLKTYISPFLVFICQKIIRISIDIIFTFICILACPFLFLSAYYTLQKWGSGKVSI